MLVLLLLACTDSVHVASLSRTAAVNAEDTGDTAGAVDTGDTADTGQEAVVDTSDTAVDTGAADTAVDSGTDTAAGDTAADTAEEDTAGTDTADSVVDTAEVDTAVDTAAADTAVDTATDTAAACAGWALDATDVHVAENSETYVTVTLTGCASALTADSGSNSSSSGYLELLWDTALPSSFDGTATGVLHITTRGSTASWAAGSTITSDQGSSVFYVYVD